MCSLGKIQCCAESACRHRTSPLWLANLLLLASGLLASPLLAQKTSTPETPDSAAAKAAARTGAKTGQTAGAAKNATETTSTQSDSKSATGSSTSQAIAPSVAPPGPTDRPRIGLALGGGGALALSEIGVLQWFEEHHIPVDVIAGTSMGCMVSALYSTGTPIDRLKVVMNDSVFNQVFSFGSSYSSRSFRRREDSRALPNALTIGLRHGVSFRNSVLTDEGLNAFLDRRFFRYDDRVDFNTLPIPLRCISTDLTDAKAVTFARGSIPDAVRASVSLPGVYQPFSMNGHEFVDGGVLLNLPTPTVRDMKADVILAVSLPLQPVVGGDLGSLLGVLQRSFSVAIEGAEREQRKLAQVVLMPDLTGFTATDYLRTADLSRRGYIAAEQQKSALLQYAVSDIQWQQYLSARIARQREPPGPVLRIRIKAPSEDVTRALQRKFAPLVNQPVDTHAIEALLDEIRSDGRYEADYTVAYESTKTAAVRRTDSASESSSQTAAPNPADHTAGEQNPQPSPADPTATTDSSPTLPAESGTRRPVVLVTVSAKKTGPPFLLVGANIQAQTGGITRATLENIFLYQDLGGYGSELRGNIKVGFLTQVDAEYYRRIFSTGSGGGYFLAPHAGVLRQPFYIYQGQRSIAERLLQRTFAGADIGWSDARTHELRLGYEAANIRWQTEVGTDARPDIIGSSQRVRARYVFDTQDRALIPQFGIRSTTELAYLFNTVGSSNAPQITTQLSIAHQIGKNLFLFATEGGTMLNRNVAQPFRFTLGGPLRLTASAIDEYRGTDYFLLEPAFLRRIAKLPDPLGQSIYLGAAYEAGQIHAPGTPTITRQDIYFGIVAETPLGVVTLAPAIGDDGHRKFVFTLGKLF